METKSIFLCVNLLFLEVINPRIFRKMSHNQFVRNTDQLSNDETKTIILNRKQIYQNQFYTSKILFFFFLLRSSLPPHSI